MSKGFSVSISDRFETAETKFSPQHELLKAHSVVLIDGVGYRPIEWTINKNGHGATDDATITIQNKGNPDWTRQLFRGTPEGASSSKGKASHSATDNTPVYVEIWAGFRDTPAPTLDRTGLSQRFFGIVDLYSIIPDKDETTFNCRSMAAPLVDNKLTDAPLGMKSVDFVKRLADQLGMKAVTALNPGNPITLQEVLGREFVGGSNFNSTVFNLKPWDLLLQAAVFDDADVWVEGDTIYYMSPERISRKTITLVYGKDYIQNPVLTHAPQFNKHIRVEVRTNTPRTRQSTTVRVETNPDGGIKVSQSSRTVTSSPIFGTPDIISHSFSTNGTGSTTSSSTSSQVSGGSFTGSNKPGSESGLEVYKKYWPNLTPARANELAKSLWRSISQHEYQIKFGMPVTAERLADFSITSLIVFTGLPYSLFNKKYWPKKFSESFGFSGGWKWEIDCVSHILASGAV